MCSSCSGAIFHFSMLRLVLFCVLYTEAHGFNFTEESCNDDFNRVKQEFLSPTVLIQGISVEPDDIEYILFTKDLPVEETIIDEDTRELINTELETKIIVSGWLEGYNRKWVLEMRDAYLKRGRYNIIFVNWDEYAYMHFIFSTQICQGVGQSLGNFIVSLVDSIKLDLSKTHLIGHSLGAHICGFAGQQIIKKLWRKVGRISALDAAGPIFNFNTESYRLDRGDATFVDAIHTNSFVLGYKAPLATVDIFINNGVFQPGCPTIGDLMNKPLTCYNIHTFLFCSHVKSISLWQRSVLNETFVARHVFTGSPIIVGENSPRNKDGDYLLSAKFN